MSFTQYVPSDAVWKSVLSSADRLSALTAGVEQLTDQHLHRLVGPLGTGSIDGIVSRVMLDAAQRSEKRCPFSSGLALRTLSGHIKKSSAWRKEDRLACVANIQEASERSIWDLMDRTRVPTSSEFAEILSKFIKSDIERALISEIIDQGGLDGKFTIEVGKHGIHTPIVESTLGYNFPLHSAVVTEVWERSEPRVVIIDGVVEHVHEVHHLLTAASQKFPLLLVARDFSDDVLHTLKVNCSRGTLDILPIRVPIEVESLNTLKDIAVICNCDIVSPMKGQTISGISIEKLNIVDSVSYKTGLLTISNKDSSNSAKLHASMLKEARDEGSPEMAGLYESRIKSMSPNHTLVKLPATYDSLSVKTFAQNIGSGLRLVKAIHEAGVSGYGNDIDVTLRTAIASRFAASQLAVIVSFDGMLLPDPVTQRL